ncbi:TetR/AcrR family transcriptional regulator [Nocardia thailandica]|uniref:TetR/AcrR family transcriptional regulator n=1 Tax=Nocardia thailandica TaxID=257275 RepID=A0ABW6PSE0_9NOCA|nr:TetR/AcrR family transcriptional regulator [Nocardia thailandica]
MSRVVTKEQYFDTALTVVAEFGFRGLNIGMLCRRLGVTSGSFYHHFGSWQGFVDALLDDWENRQMIQLRALDVGTADPEHDVRALSELARALPHGAEAALRAWAANDPTVGATLTRVDDSRRRTLRRVIGGVVRDQTAAGTVTDLGMAVLIGYQQMAAAGTETELRQLLAQFARLLDSYRDPAQSSSSST